MIEIRVTNEISGYEPKIIGPFTGRQLLCVVPGAVICYFIISKLSPILTIDACIPICAIPAVIGWAIGWCEPYGMKMEKFIRAIFVTRVLAPSIRRYKTENVQEKIFRQMSMECMAERALAEQQDQKKNKNKRQSKPKRYKLSPKAYK